MTILAGRTIAISISESPDLSSLGLGEEHLLEAMFEFARHLLLLGATVAYGGDLRPGGFTENLSALARKLGERDTPLVRSYLAWPMCLDLTQAREDDLMNLFKFEKLPEVTATVDATVPLPPKDTAAQLVWARNLTAMRRRMAVDCDARIVLGGRLTGAQGTMPGIVEEVVETLRAKKPVFVLGGFGGAGRAVWNALNGERVPALSLDAQEAGKPGYRQFVQAYNAWAAGVPGEEPVDYERLAATLRDVGPAGLRCGLDADQRGQLASTVHVPEMLRLVLTGLKSVFAKPAPGTA